MGENTEKYITLSEPIKKQITKIAKDGNDKIVDISYKIKFIDSFRFMSSSLSNLVDNLFEGPHSDKCTYCKSCLEYMMFRDDQRSCTQWNCIQLIFRCFECKKNYEKDFNNESIKRFANIYELDYKDINKFLLLLKGVYLYEYMASWERFDETSLPDKGPFYSSLKYGKQ